MLLMKKKEKGKHNIYTKLTQQNTHTVVPEPTLSSQHARKHKHGSDSSKMTYKQHFHREGRLHIGTLPKYRENIEMTKLAKNVNINLAESKKSAEKDETVFFRFE